MEKSSDIVKKYYKASAKHDFQAMRALIRDDYQFDGPLMQAKNADEFFAKMSAFDCAFDHNILKIVDNGDDVAVLFDCTFKKPFSATIRMSEWLAVEGGKIKSSKLLYDTSKFPKEFSM